MTAFDTSVLVPILQRTNAYHLSCRDALDAALESGGACCSQHTLAELFAVVTRLPDRLAPALAVEAIDDLTKHIEVVALIPDDYHKAQMRIAQLGLTGGRIYDLLHLMAAERAGATLLMTANTRHFEPLLLENSISLASP